MTANSVILSCLDAGLDLTFGRVSDETIPTALRGREPATPTRPVDVLFSILASLICWGSSPLICLLHFLATVVFPFFDTLRFVLVSSLKSSV